MKISISLLSALLLSLAMPVYANHDGNSSDHRCERQGRNVSAAMSADTDNDGSVDWEEAHSAFVRHFDEMDSNQDGVLTPDEAKGCCIMSGSHCTDGKKSGMAGDACKRQRGAHDKGSKEFNAADVDHDGTLTKSEAKKLKRVYRNFDAIDVDQDGTVDRDEVHNFMHDHPMGK